MTMQEETTLLLIGAGIALASSLITAIVTALITYQIDKRKREKEQQDYLLELLGKHKMLISDDAKDVSEWAAKIGEGSPPGPLSIGIMQGLIEKTQEIKKN